MQAQLFQFRLHYYLAADANHIFDIQFQKNIEITGFEAFYYVKL
jgi:hypothetical protein